MAGKSRRRVRKTQRDWQAPAAWGRQGPWDRACCRRAQPCLYGQQAAISARIFTACTVYSRHYLLSGKRSPLQFSLHTANGYCEREKTNPTNAPAGLKQRM